MTTYDDVWRETPLTYGRVEVLRRPTDEMDIEELTVRALELQSEADRAQRAADGARSALFARRRVRIAAGEPVPAAPSGLPGWTAQARSELIAFENAEIDREAARRRG